MSDRDPRSALQVPFGLKDGRLFEPTQVDNGLRCGCVCPGCGAVLIAKHSPAGKVTPHFAHASDAACSTGLETALHLAAKQLIADSHSLYFPELVAHVESLGKFGNMLHRSELVRPGGLAQLQAVRLEEKVGAIRPDLVVETFDQVVHVEIANTHFIDQEKLARIKLQGVATLEVDVSDITNLNFETLGKRLFEPAELSKWAYHPEKAARELALQSLLEADLEADLQRWTQAQFEARQAAARHNARAVQYEQDRLEAERVLALQRAADIARAHAVPPEQRLADALTALRVARTDIGQFLPSSVRCSSSIQARPLVWQASVFAALIQPALKEGNTTISSEQVLTWLSERFKVDMSTSSSAVAVWYFLAGLADCHILHKKRGQEFLVAIPDIGGALRVASDVRGGGMQELCWGDIWPSPAKSAAVASVFADVYGNRNNWERLAGLLPEVRQRETPIATMAAYIRVRNGSIDAKALRRYFLATGLAKLQVAVCSQ